MNLKVKRLTETAKLPVKNNQTDSGEIWIWKYGGINHENKEA